MFRPARRESPGKEVVLAVPLALVPAPRGELVPSFRSRVWEFFSPEPTWSLISPQERCKILTNLHWFVPLKAVAAAVAMWPTTLVLALLLSWVAPGVWWLQLIMVLLSVGHQAYLFYLVLVWRADQIVVTNKQIIRSGGVFTTSVGAVDLDKITYRDFYQSFLGRLFDYGTLFIESPGDSPASTHRVMERIDFLPSPRRVYRATLVEDEYIARSY